MLILITYTEALLVKNYKLDTLLRINKKSQTREVLFKSVPVRHLHQYQKALSELQKDDYVSLGSHSVQLVLTKQGREFLFNWQLQLEIRRRDNRNFIVSSLLSIIAIAISVLALLL